MGLYDDSVGAFVVGTLVSTALLGITASQCWTYYSNFPNDKRVYWYSVTFLLAFDIFHSAISCYTIWLWCVENYGNPAILVKSPWSFTIEPAMTGLVSLICQTFYAYRVYIVSKRSRALPCVIMILSAVAFGFSVGATAQIVVLESEFSRFQSWNYGVCTWLATAAACDIVITASLVYYLNKSHIIDRIVSNVVATNGLTASVAIIDTIAFAASNTSWHVVPQLCLIKLYFNSFLVSLNQRVELERQLALARPGLSSSGGGVGDNVNGSNQLRTPLGFGAQDVRPGFWARARAGAPSRKGHRSDGISKSAISPMNFTSGVHVETIRVNHEDTYVELDDIQRKFGPDPEKGHPMGLPEHHLVR